MKQFRNRVIFVVGVAWMIVLCHTVYIWFTQSLITQGARIEYLIIFLGTMFVFIATLLVSMFRAKSKSDLSWKSFLKSEIDIFDEDERSLFIDSTVRKTSGNVILCSALTIWVIYETLLSNHTISLSHLLMIIVLLFTAYQWITYREIKRAYESDVQGRPLRYTLLLSVTVAISVIMIQMGVTMLYDNMMNEPKQEVSIVVRNMEQDSVSYSIAVAGFVDSSNDVILVTGRQFDQFNRILKISDSDAEVIIYQGSLNEFEVTRDRMLNEEGQSLSEFYSQLNAAELVFSDLGRDLAILRLTDE